MSEEPKTFDEAAWVVATELARMLIAKQHDYGPNNILQFGRYGLVVRLYDKWARAERLTGLKVEPQNEALEDTWRDFCGYGMIGIMLERGWFTLPLEDATPE